MPHPLAKYALAAALLLAGSTLASCGDSGSDAPAEAPSNGQGQGGSAAGGKGGGGGVWGQRIERR